MTTALRITILLRTADLLSQSKRLSKGGYAQDQDGKAIGLFSQSAFTYDLASALFRACEEHTPDSREANFATLWREARVAANQLNGKDSGFCQWLDRHSLSWHLALINKLAGIERPVRAKAKAIVETDWL